MHAHKTIKIDLLDIIFAGRNKEYGAYELRKTYYKRISIALLTTLIIVSGVLIFSVISERQSQRDAALEMRVREVSLGAFRTR